MTVHVGEVMQLPLMQNTVLIAGRAGLDREIETANIADSPDIANWMRPNQLLLTTAYHFRERPEGLIPFLHRLNDIGCAGLAVKTKRYIDVLPEGMIQAADRLAFPLIELPNNLLLGDVLNQILERVLNEKHVELQRAFEVHRRFSDLFLRGASMSDIARTLHALIKRPVLILNTRGEVSGYSDAKAGRLAATGAAGDLRAALKAASFREHEVTAVRWNASETADVYPVLVGGSCKGYLCVLNDGAASASLAMMPLEQASHVVAFEHMRQEALAEGEKRLRRQFFHDWLDQRLSREEIDSRARIYGLSAGEGCLVAVSSADPAPEEPFPKRPGNDPEGRLEQDLSRARQYFESAQTRAVCELKGKRLLVILPLAAEDSAAFDESRYLSLLQGLRQFLEAGRPDATFSCGVSSLAEHYRKIPQAYREADQALNNGYALRKKQFLYTYRTQQVTELLGSIPESKLRDFYVSSLGELAFSDLQEHRELLQTLDCYLNHDGSIAETAKALYIHRNTVLNRIARCEKLLRISAKDPTDTLKMRIALTIHRLYEDLANNG